MLRLICCALFAFAATPALAESPPPPECPCMDGWVCRPLDQICYPEDVVCETTSDCDHSGLICDRRDGEAAFPGLCRIQPAGCNADADCADRGLLCTANPYPPLVCAEGDEICEATDGLACGRPALCGEPNDAPCRDDHVCVQSRCTPPEFVAILEEVDADADLIEAYRNELRPLGEASEGCSAAPGHSPGSGVALLGLVLGVALRRRR